MATDPMATDPITTTPETTDPIMSPDKPGAAATESQWLFPDLEDEDAGPFWQGCAAGELRVQTCEHCGAWRMPPRPMCPQCRSIESRWVTTSGQGRVWSFIVPHPPLLPGYSELAPYNVVIIELIDNPLIRFVGNLVAAPAAAINSVDPTSIAIGEAVHVTFEKLDDVTFPRWIRQ